MRRQMASPIDNYSQQVIRSRYALAPPARRFAQCHTVLHSETERAKRAGATPMGVLRTVLNKG